METLQSIIFIEFDVNTKKITFLRGDNIVDYDSNATSVYVRVKYKNLSGNTVYLTPSELKDYKFSLYTIKPATNNVNLIRGEVTDELKENVYGGVVKFEIPRKCTNRLGIVKCEIHINQGNKTIGSSTFVLDVKQSLVTAFDDELLGDEDFPVLKQLILEIQKDSNIDDNNRNKITTYSSDKIETIKEDLSSQIIDNDNRIENRIENIKEDLSSQIKEKASNVDLETERQRINNLTSLPEGSTTGDAELIDGRIGVDGFAYDNIGSAIRKQINELKNGNLNSKSITIDKLSDVQNDITYKKVICRATEHFAAFNFSIDKSYACENSVTFNATFFSKNKDITVQVNIVKDGDSTIYESNQITIYKGIRTDCSFTINVNIASGQTIFAYIIINSNGNTENEIEIINPKIVCDTQTLNIHGKGISVVQGCTLSKKEESYLGLSRYSNFYNKKILFLGDSITDTSWANMYPYYISEITGAKNINYAVASSGYGMNAYYAHNIWGKDNTSIPAMSQRAYDDGIIDVDLVVVAGGTNDWDFGVPLGEFNDIHKTEMTTPSLYFSVAQTIKKLFYLYPYTPIQVLSPIPRNQPNGSGDQYNPKNNGKTLVDFSNAIKEVCEYYSVPFMNNLLSSNIKLNDEKNRGIYTQDGLHPTDFYSKIYAKMVISEISKWL